MIERLLKKISNHIVFKNTVALSVVKVAEYVFPYLTIPFITRKLGMESFGLWILCMSIYSLALIITDYGFGLSATYNVSKNRGDKGYLNDYMSAIFALKSLFGLLSITLISSYFLFFYREVTVDPSTIILLCSIVLVQAFQPQWFFQGIEKMKYITVADVLSKFSYMLFVFLLVSLRASINMVLLSFLISNIISSSIYLRLIYLSGIRLHSPRWSTMWRELQYSSAFFLSRVALALSSTANNFLVANVMGLRDAALFGSADKLYNGCFGVLHPINAALYPYMAKTRNVKMLYRVTALLFLLSTGCCVIVSYFAEDVIRIIFGADYIEATPLLRLFLFAVPINVVSILFGYPAFASINKLKFANLSVIISGAVYFCILLFLYFTKNITKENIIYSIIIIDLLTLIMRLTFFFIYRKKQTE